MLESFIRENPRGRTSLKRAHSPRGGVAKLRVSRETAELPEMGAWSRMELLKGIPKEEGHKRGEKAQPSLCLRTHPPRCVQLDKRH